MISGATRKSRYCKYDFSKKTHKKMKKNVPKANPKKIEKLLFLIVFWTCIVFNGPTRLFPETVNLTANLTGRRLFFNRRGKP